MNSTGSHTMQVNPVHPFRLLLAAMLALVLAACGGGGTVPPTGVEIASPGAVAPQPGSDARPLSAEFSKRKAVAYSPFRSANRDTEDVTDAMVREDLALLAQGQFTLLRVFDSSDKVAERLLRIIRDDKLDFKVMLGAYIFSEKDQTLTPAQVQGNIKFNQAEVDRAVKLANDYKDIVLAVSVGNETLVSWSGSAIASTPTVVAGYIKYVRDRVTQPLTSDDNWAFYAKKSGEPHDPRLVIDAVDFISMHTYPLLDTVPPAVPNWDWEQQAAPERERAVAMMDAAIEAAKSEYAAVRAHLDSLGQQAKPIIVGETGWKAEPVGGTANRAHPVNQKMYFDRLKAWSEQARASGSGPFSIVYFEAFDEPWKVDDDKWGLFTVARKARHVIQDLALYPDTSMWDARHTDADAVFAPTVTSSTISANRYTLYSDAVTDGEVRVDPIARPSALTDLNLKWFGWDNPATAFSGEFTGVVGDGEGHHYVEVGPAPKDWGWGMLTTYSNTTDLSQFAATGRLNFRIKTQYPGKLRVGFVTGGKKGFDVYITISNDNADGYGYKNDNQWHDVSIPISKIIEAVPKTTDGTTPDMSKVIQPFVVNDVFATTGNSGIKGSPIPLKILLDNIYWSK